MPRESVPLVPPSEPWFARTRNGAKLIRFLDPAQACGVEEVEREPFEAIRAWLRGLRDCFGAKTA